LLFWNERRGLTGGFCCLPPTLARGGAGQRWKKEGSVVLLVQRWGLACRSRAGTGMGWKRGSMQCWRHTNGPGTGEHNKRRRVEAQAVGFSLSPTRPLVEHPVSLRWRALWRAASVRALGWG